MSLSIMISIYNKMIRQKQNKQINEWKRDQ